MAEDEISKMTAEFGTALPPSACLKRLSRSSRTSRMTLLKDDHETSLRLPKLACYTCSLRIASGSATKHDTLCDNSEESPQHLRNQERTL